MTKREPTCPTCGAICPDDYGTKCRVLEFRDDWHKSPTPDKPEWKRLIETGHASHGNFRHTPCVSCNVICAAVQRALDKREIDTFGFVFAGYVQSTNEPEFKGWLRNIVRSMAPEMTMQRAAEKRAKGKS